MRLFQSSFVRRSTAFTIAIAFAAMTFSWMATSAAHASTSAPQALNSAGTISTQTPALIGSNSGVVIAANDSLDTNTSIGAINLFRSLDGGATWSAPVQLSSPGVNANQVALAKLNDGAIIATWAEESGPSATYEIHIARSIDDGLTWSTANIVGSTGSSSSFAELPKAAAWGASGVALTYVIEDGSQTRVVVRTSSDFSTWMTPAVLSSPSTYADQIALTVSGLSVTVAWVENDTNTGRTVKVANSSNWSSPANLSGAASAASLSVALATLSGGNVVVAWSNPVGGNLVMKARMSNDQGVSWQSVNEISRTAIPSDIALTATTDGGVTAAWAYGTGGYTTISTNHSAPGATSWPNSEVAVTTGVTGTYEYSPTIASQTNGNLSMVWTKNVSGSPRVYCASGATSSDFGASWTLSGCVSPTYTGAGAVAGTSIAPLLATGSVTSWQAHTSFTGGYVTVTDWTKPLPSTPNLPDTGYTVRPALLVFIGLLLAGCAAVVVARRSSQPQAQRAQSRRR